MKEEGVGESHRAQTDDSYVGGIMPMEGSVVTEVCYKEVTAYLDPTFKCPCKRCRAERKRTGSETTS